MNSNYPKRLHDMEIAPPQQVWEKLSAELQEIDADKLLVNKMSNAEVQPPITAWENINEVILADINNVRNINTKTVRMRRIAMAAAFAGLLGLAWYLFFTEKQQNNSLSSFENRPVPNNIQSQRKDDIKSSIEHSENSTNKIIATTDEPSQIKNKLTKQTGFSNSDKHFINPLLILNEKKSEEKAEELIASASVQDYRTIVNANGREVKIPATLSYLIPQLENQPFNLDDYDNLFGEGAIWKDKLSAWRQLLATSPVTYGDIFSPLAEFLKTVQPAPADVPEKSR